MRCLFPLVLLLLSSVAHAQNPFWQPAGGPPGARIEHVAYDSVRGITLAASRSTLYRLAPGETRWQVVFRTADRIADLHVHSTHAIFVSTLREFDGSRQGTLWRSEDGGVHWDLASLAVQSSKILVATDPAGALYAVGGAVLFRSEDSGRSWSTHALPWERSDVLAFGASGEIYIVSYVFDGMMSTDGGATWIPLVGYSDTDLLAFAVDTDGWAYASLVNWGTSYYVAVTDTLAGPNGLMVNWKDGRDLPTTQPVRTLVAAPGGAMFAGTYGDGVYRTPDHGVTWQRAGLRGHYVLSLATGPAGLLFAGTTEGVFRSTDDGATWALLREGLSDMPVTALLPLTGEALLAGTDGAGVFRYSAGMGWERQASPDPFVHSLDHSSARTRFLSTEGGLYRSTDGLAWDTLYFPISTTIARPLATRSVVETPDGVLFAATFEAYDPRFGEIYRSTDDGRTWHSTNFVQIPDRMPIVPSQLVVAHDGSVLNVGGLIYRFEPSDTTWTDFTPQGFGRFPAAAAGPDGTVWVGAGTALLRLDADGTTWHVVSEEIEGARDLAVNDRGHLFAATPEGVFRSTDAGTTWDDVGAGLDGAAVQVLTIDEEGVLWAGTAGRGVFRSVVPTAWEAQAPATPASRTVGFPNPFAEATTIQVTLERAGLVRLTVYDVRGRLVATLLDEWRPAGTFDVAFDGRRLAPGIYFYTLEADGQRVTRPIVRAR